MFNYNTRTFLYEIVNFIKRSASILGVLLFRFNTLTKGLWNNKNNSPNLRYN